MYLDRNPLFLACSSYGNFILQNTNFNKIKEEIEKSLYSKEDIKVDDGNKK